MERRAWFFRIGWPISEADGHHRIAKFRSSIEALKCRSPKTLGMRPVAGGRGICAVFWWMDGTPYSAYSDRLAVF
jgi:hypothetical protein